jgi:hypothetical protein
MLRAITMPIRTLSENVYRGMNRFVKHTKTKTQRENVKLLLRQLRVVPRVVGGQPNRYEVKLVRISAGELDDDNLRGSLKAVRDEVAEWIGLDDRDPLIVWKYGQEKAKQGTCGVRIEVRDQEQGAEQIVHLGLASSAKAKAKKAPKEKTPKPKKSKPAARPPIPTMPIPTPLAAPDQKQRALAFVRSAAILPWKQSSAEELEVTELHAFENVDPAPTRAHVRAPDGARVIITRRGLYDVDGLGMTWLLVVAGFE